MAKKLGFVTLVLIGSAVGGVFAVVTFQAGGPVRAQSSPLPAPPPATADAFEAVVANLTPSVVAVDAVKPPATTM